MYLLGKRGGIRPQDVLWQYIANGMVSVHQPAEGEWQRMRTLMNDYADAPMDFADASLVTASETLQEHRIFTTDRHFRIYRQQQGRAFEVVP